MLLTKLKYATQFLHALGSSPCRDETVSDSVIPSADISSFLLGLIGIRQVQDLRSKVRQFTEAKANNFFN